MKAYELLSKLKYLTLAGYEDGNYLWVGTSYQWQMAKSEELQFLTQ